MQDVQAFERNYASCTSLLNVTNALRFLNQTLDFHENMYMDIPVVGLSRPCGRGLGEGRVHFDMHMVVVGVLRTCGRWSSERVHGYCQKQWGWDGWTGTMDTQVV